MMETAENSIVWKEGTFFVAQCLTVNVSRFGTSREEALQNLNEALTLYFEDGTEKASAVPS